MITKNQLDVTRYSIPQKYEINKSGLSAIAATGPTLILTRV